MRGILSKIVSPTCTPLAVAAAFVVGSLTGAWTDAPWWGGIAVAAGVGVTYGVLLDVLRRIVHRRETA